MLEETKQQQTQLPAMSKKRIGSEMEVDDEEATDGTKIQLPLEPIQDESERRDIRRNYRDFISSLQGNVLMLT